MDNVIFDAVEKSKILPHRYPFVMLDRVVELVSNDRIVAVKNVTAGEQHFQGHFPGRPVMPGVLILESMAQAAAILAIKSEDGMRDGKVMYLVGCKEVKWRKQVVPGDTVYIEMKSVRKRRPLWVMSGEAKVAGKIVAEAIISAMEADE